jgi:outer membrane lipoprotein-sorting protein
MMMMVLAEGRSMRGIRLAVWVAIVLLAVGNVAATSGEAKSALKQVTKATKGVRGVVADVEYSQVIGKRSINGEGKLYAHFAGIMRVEIGGNDPRSVIFTPPLLYIYVHADEVVEVYDVTSNPHRLGQYLMLGFVPNGNALKERFDVELIENSTLDGKPVMNFLLAPKPKKAKAAAAAIARIQLWVDPESGLPAQHEIVHAMGEARLKVRYLSVSRHDELPDSLFVPDWPEGVTIQRK